MLGVLDGASRISIFENLVQAAVDEISHQRAVVTTDRFDTFAVNLVVNVGFCEVKTGIAFLVDKKVRKVDL